MGANESLLSFFEEYEEKSNTKQQSEVPIARELEDTHKAQRAHDTKPAAVKKESDIATQSHAPMRLNIKKQKVSAKVPSKAPAKPSTTVPTKAPTRVSVEVEAESTALDDFESQMSDFSNAAKKLAKREAELSHKDESIQEEKHKQSSSNLSEADKILMMVEQAKAKAAKVEEVEEETFSVFDNDSNDDDVEGEFPSKDDVLAKIRSQEGLSSELDDGDEEEEQVLPVDEEETLDDRPSPEELMRQAETYFPDEWLAAYNKAWSNMKNNPISAKVRAGRFRYTQDHRREILPNLRTDNATANELLNKKWLKE